MNEPLPTLWQRLLELSTTPILHTGQTHLTAARIGAVLLLWLVAWAIARWAERAVHRVGSQKSAQAAGIIYNIARVIRYLVWVVGATVILSVVGIDLSALALIGGAIGVGVGLGLQGLFNNVVSGLVLLVERSVQVGDWVELPSGTSGELREMGVRYSRLVTTDNVAIIVPNTELIMQRVSNTTAHDRVRRLHVPFRLPADADKQQVAEAVAEIAPRVTGAIVDEWHPAEAWLVGIEPGVLQFEMVVWVADGAIERPGTAQARLLWLLDDALRARGVDRGRPPAPLSAAAGGLAVTLAERQASAPKAGTP